MSSPSGTPLTWHFRHQHTYERLASALIQPASLLSGPWPCVVEVGHGRTDDPRYQSNGRFRPTHAYWVFQLTLRGLGELRHGATIHPCEPDSGMLLRANDPKMTYGFPAKAREPWEFVWVSFAGDAADSLAKALAAEAGPVLHLAAATGPLRPMMEVLSGASPGRLQGLSGARFVFELLAALREEASHAGEPGDRQALARLAETALLARAADPTVDVATIARELRVSREHLSRVFREQRGVPPRVWLERLRVERAGHLLRETRMSVKEVAAAAGFGTVGALIAAVRRHHGTTPGKWREWS